MRFKKGIALCLAAMFLLEPAGKLAGLPVAAAENETVEININGKLQGEVIRGSNVVVTSSNADRLGAGKKGSEDMILVTKQGQSSDFNDLFSFDKTSTVSRILMQPKLKADLSGTPLPAEESYWLNANFILKKKSGRAQETTGSAAGGQNAVGTLEVLSPKDGLGIEKYSKAKLTYQGGKTFKLEPDSTDAGVFQSWPTSLQASEHQEGSAGTKETFTFNFEDTQSHATRQILFTPNKEWTEQVRDGGTDDNPTYRTESYYNIKTNDTFDISFTYEIAEPVSLIVRDPKEVLGEVTGAAVVGSKRDNKFVSLEGDDEFLYITKNFEVESYTEQYGKKVNLEWSWEPDDSTETGAKDAVEYKSRPGQKGQFIVTRQEKDVRGKIIVKATYDTGISNTDPYNLNRDVTDDAGEFIDDEGKLIGVTATLPIEIHGRGTPATIQQLSQSTGVWDGTTYKTEEKALSGDLPASQTMDSYKNIVKDFDQTPYPFQYKLQINVGEGNGLARRIQIDAAGDTGALDLKVDSDAGTIGTAFNQPIDLPLGKQRIDITFNALRESESPINLTFRFWVEGVGGALREEIEDERKMSISVLDSRPDSTAELISLEVVDPGTNEQIGPNFSSDHTDYALIPDYATGHRDGNNQYDGAIEITPVPYVTAQKTVGVLVEYRNDMGLYVPVESGDPHGAGIFPDVATGGDLQGAKTWQIDPAKGNADRNLVYAWNVSSLGGKASRTVYLKNPGQEIRIRIWVRAQDTTTTRCYSLEITREEPSRNAKLKSLKILDREGNDYLEELLDDVQDYEVTVPYHVDHVMAEFETAHPGAKAEQVEPANTASGNAISRLVDGFRSLFSDEWGYPVPEPGGKLDFKINVKSQYDLLDPTRTGIYYTVAVKRDKPGTDGTLKALTVTKEDGTDLPLTPVFDANDKRNRRFRLEIPYSVPNVCLVAESTDPYAAMRAQNGESDTPPDLSYVDNRLNPEAKIQFLPLEQGVASKPINIPSPTADVPVYELTVAVRPEDASLPPEYYTIEITRNPPGTDATLKTVAILDQDGKEIAYDFYGDIEQTTYTVEVPYLTDKVSFTPTANEPPMQSITITCDGPIAKTTVESGEQSRDFRINKQQAGDKNSVDTIFHIVTIAEDGQHTKDYQFTVRRKPPSDDARLIKLEVGSAEEFKPVFAPNRLSYTATVAEGAQSVTITATVNDPTATLTIDGKQAVSGQPSEPVNILDIRQQVEIAVTAQDGTTKLVYVIDFKNPNLVTPGSNADLKRLEVEDGSMTPSFKPSITRYDVAVKEDAYSIDIIPKPEDKNATVQVFNGTKEIGDEDGNYSQYIDAGENNFTVRVTAEDKKKYKDYEINVYRDEEDKMGVYTPVTADDIDFENTGDVVFVDVSKYPRVDSDVFEELKNYPEKELVLEGNDYSFRFKASDLNRVIPNTDYFDFKMRFTSPNEEEIYDLIDEYAANEDADVVIVHFDHHGALPGPAVLSIGLGKKYRDERLYWHYYNEEWERLDYYGAFNTNSRGSFNIRIDHLSDYVVADMRLRGSETRTTDGLETGEADFDLGRNAALGKNNPGTGVSEGGQ